MFAPFQITRKISSPAEKMTMFSLKGIARKVSLCSLSLFAIGYVIYIIGWGNLVSPSSRPQPSLFAFWYCVAAGPLVFILCLLRAVLLLQANAHYVLMVITFMFISSYISAGGFILYYIGAFVNSIHDAYQLNLIFAGMIISQIFTIMTGAVLGFIDVKRGKEMQVV
ncbi:hypothetical protein EMCRGX_G003253 [Ephydatia muelleri]